MRKVLGAQRKQLISQFLGESFLLTLISFVLAIGLAAYLLPLFNRLLAQPIELNLITNYGLIAVMFLIAILVGGLSGLYPAVFLSSVTPMKAMAGDLVKNFKQGTSLRNILVVGQFTHETFRALVLVA